MTAEPIFVDTAEAARLLGLSPSTLEKYRFHRAPDAPPFVKIGRAVRYRITDLEAWAANRGAEQ
jgi:predicted DNA-binding transcriptional regulator AlpA